MWCINLRERPDRKKKMEKLFCELGILDRVRFHIVDRDPRGGIAGCFQSHYDCLKQSNNPGPGYPFGPPPTGYPFWPPPTGYPFGPPPTGYVIVFEDDCDIRCVDMVPVNIRERFMQEMWKTVLRDIERTFDSNPNVDFFSVGCIPLQTKRTLQTLPVEIIEGTFTTTLCYAVRQSAMKRVLSNMQESIGKYHVDYYYWKKLRQCGYSVPLFVQNFGDTNNPWIESSQVVEKVARKVGSTLQTSKISRMLCNLQYYSYYLVDILSTFRS